ncbi:putative phosphohydrolase [Rhizobium leguminosarum bv. trifolii WSM2297]|uniref:Putative phosphohydrolase n=1 Tax=Rhizobium leguminosarum bv. trifolii WSM2297 TaxID=754762 RepID=J0L519_RHILT|nr:metallophosphoesterase [Rhizobium leguminosarum]EJC85404.1 putative phosphohydrolase [Rhizobium leguminosarum bv. trifolii WSM2297]
MLIAQISDIHARPDLSSLRTLGRAIGWLRVFRPDALVVTGDLVDDAWREGYRLIAESLHALDCPVHLLPGNGDDVQLMRSEFAAIGTWLGAPGPLHFRVAVDDLTLFGVDVTVAGQSYGDLLPHLPWLTSALAAVTTPVLLFMHQPPFRIGIEVLDQVGCRNGHALLGALEGMDRQPLAILCGHVHRPISGRLGSIPVRTCGSLCPPNPLLLEGRDDLPIIDAPSFLVHDVSDGRLISHIVSIAAPA